MRHSVTAGIALAVGLVAGGATVGFAGSGGSTADVCVNSNNGMVRVDDECRRSEYPLTIEGAQGPQGPEGPQGSEGPQGPEGAQGSEGAQGPEGAQGSEGAQGPAGAQGPEGSQGPEGPLGPEGPQGPAGPGSAAFGTDTQGADPGRGGDCVLGEVILTAGSVAHGGANADGQLLPINSNQALFSLFGTLYGGDGETTFGLPDLGDAAPNGLTYTICISGLYPSRN
jgi:hypothetical protein